MNRKLAFDNRLCYEREVARQHSLHHHKLETVLPTSLSPSRVYLDSSAPARHPHLASNAKRLQLERERQTLIYQQNQRLADRMEHILHRQENAFLATSHALRPAPPPPATPRAQTGDADASVASPSSPTPSTASPRGRSTRKQPIHSPARVHVPGMRLDANQTPLIDCHLSPEFAMGRGNACTKQSLVNKAVQRRKQAQIEEENQRLRQRLARLKPYYDAKRWDGEWRQHGKRFGHLRQDGTVGYLLPPPPKTAPPTDGRPPTRSLRPRRSTRPRDGELPAIRSSGEAKAPSTERSRRQLKHRAALRTNEDDNEEEDAKEDEEEEEEEEMQLIELPLCTLLEATTRKGVKITIGELQIELARLDGAAEAEAGDRGFVVFGAWSDGSAAFEGKLLVDLPLLAQVAQEVDDLETMIKLETVVHVPDVGNFPRLSTLLAEEELQQLLVGVVRNLRFQLVTDAKELRITCRLGATPCTSTPSRPPRARAESGSVAGAWRDRARPKTCPSTLPSGPEASARGTSADEAALEATVLDEDARGVARPARQLAALTRGALSRRFGVRLGARYALVVVSRFDEASGELVVRLLGLVSREEAELERRVRLDSAQTEEMARRLNAGVSLREVVVGIADQLGMDAPAQAGELYSTA